MLKPATIATSLLLALSSAAVFAQSTQNAQNAQNPTTDARTHRIEGLETSPYKADPAKTAASDADSKAAAKTDTRNCLRETGSLIKAKKGHCLPIAGRVYTKDDLDRTGERDLAPALQKLDPSITTRGH
ncbi:hypothetical protein SAMN05216570_2126 [Dyella sp. OK004]|uniref:hypothetical protein n=1 Tax=Dyella sp. OK004 TaxID=1855292 RepID=UPI0008E50DAB|nr:hypothetical protein [Dyella sp. OK004]SFS06322.1 hypothetical protein SAMN05216570_2126 [Dyella sp. OK004]